MGGDAFVGTTLRDFLELFEHDSETKMVAFFGEIGTSMEEDAAEFIRGGGFTKPMVAYVSGRYARPDVRFGHAGAMITRGVGAAPAKQEALRAAGVRVVDHFGDIGRIAVQILSDLDD
jgi:succinyl-CoA synthetase alpha subunit